MIHAKKCLTSKQQKKAFVSGEQKVNKSRIPTVIASKGHDRSFNQHLRLKQRSILQKIKFYTRRL